MSERNKRSPMHIRSAAEVASDELAQAKIGALCDRLGSIEPDVIHGADLPLIAEINDAMRFGAVHTGLLAAYDNFLDGVQEAGAVSRPGLTFFRGDNDIQARNTALGGRLYKFFLIEVDQAAAFPTPNKEI